MKRLIVAILLIITGGNIQAQNAYKGGFMFQLQPDFSFNKGWKLNTKLEARQIFFEGLNKEPFTHSFRYERTDLEMVLSKKISPQSAVGMGYLVRLEDGLLSHRFIQQFSFSPPVTGFRLGHRFRTDETLKAHSLPKYRLRYRISFEKALNGLQVDPDEMYLKLSNEYLQSLQGRKYDLEIRAKASLGFNISDKSQLEAGLDYRVEELLSHYHEQLLWLDIGWYLSF